MRRRSLLLTGPERLEWVEEEASLLQPDELLMTRRRGASAWESAWSYSTGIARMVLSRRRGYSGS